MDIKCVVCGEPWDSYHVQHDMSPWERDLFRAGSGCPSCEGVPPGGSQFEMTALADCENGDGDPGERISASERFAAGKAPKWERPADPVLWTCDGCGVEVIRDLDDLDEGLAYRIPVEARCRGWHNSHRYRDEDATEEPAHVFGVGAGRRRVCANCLDSCADCGAPISSILEFDDVYEEGYSWLPEGCYARADGVCGACYEKRCSECGERYEDCECGKREECEECGEEIEGDAAAPHACAPEDAKL